MAESSARRLSGLLTTTGGERIATVRGEMMDSMEAGVGIYRREATLTAACDKIAELRERYRGGLQLDDRSRAFNTEWLSAIELVHAGGGGAMATAPSARRESRGAHMRLDGDEWRVKEFSSIRIRTLVERTARITICPCQHPSRRGLRTGRGQKRSLGEAC